MSRRYDNKDRVSAMTEHNKSCGGNKMEEIKEEVVETKITEPEVKKEEGEKKYSDADVDEIIDKKFKQWAKRKDDEVEEAKKLAEMNEKERKEHEKNVLQKRVDELELDKRLSTMTTEARKMFNDKEITVSDDLLKALVVDDAEQTKTNVDSFVQMFNTTIENELKKRLATPKPKAITPSTSTMTKQEIMRIKDDEERQKQITLHPELFSYGG